MAAKPTSRHSTAPRRDQAGIAKAGRKHTPARPAARNSGAAWSGRFAEPVSERVKRYTASVGFDKRLAAHDIRGSIAHARMLRAAGILSASDLRAIERGFATILREIASARFAWSLDAEDVHMNI